MSESLVVNIESQPVNNTETVSKWILTHCFLLSSLNARYICVTCCFFEFQNHVPKKYEIFINRNVEKMLRICINLTSSFVSISNPSRQRDSSQLCSKVPQDVGHITFVICDVLLHIYKRIMQRSFQLSSIGYGQVISESIIHIILHMVS